MEYFWILLIIAIIAILTFVVIHTKKRRVDKKVDTILSNLAIPNVPQNWSNSEATPLGMRVIWNGEVFNSESDKQFAFECFDVGFKNAFNAMGTKYPTWDFNPAFVNIGIIEPTTREGENKDGYNALMDKFGRKVGGAVVGTGDGYPLLVIIIPSQKSNGWTYADFQMRIIWHEYEHFQEFRSDTIEFLKYSGTVPEFGPDNHPHHSFPEGVTEIPAPVVRNAPRGLFDSNYSTDIVCAGVSEPKEEVRL